SHDREFAEQYADRIIELSDGHVISDVELDTAPVTEKEAAALDFHDNIVEVPCGYHLTEEDREAINSYIEKLKEGSLEITVSRKNEASKRFVATDTSKIKSEDGSSFKLIKSKLPLKNAFKIGASGLKHKKIRLVFTILLSCIAFGLFGLSDTFGAYNHIKTCTNSLVDSEVKYLSVAKSKKIPSGSDYYWRDYGYGISEKNLEEVSDGSGVKMHGVFSPANADLSFDSQINPDIKLTETDYNIYSRAFSGFAEINDSVIKDMGFRLLAGTLPDGTKDEIAVSEYVFEIFKKAQYFDGTTYNKAADGTQTPVYQKVTAYNDLIGKTITLNNVKYTITAIVDTGFDISRYSSLTEKKDHQSKAEQMVDYVLYNEYSSSSAYSYAGVIMVGKEKMEKLISERPPMTTITEGYISFYSNTGKENEDYGVDSQYLATLQDVKGENIIWIDGEKKTLGEKEIIATKDALQFYNGNPDTEDYAKYLKNKNTLSAWESDFNDNENTDGWKLVGIIDNTLEGNKSKLNSTIVTSDSVFKKYTDGSDNIYSFAVGAMPAENEEVRSAVAYCYREDSNIRYQIQNSVTFELDSVNDVLKILSKYFFWIGIGFAAFAALMLANFIGTSISYKKQEIGILRAIGSRSNDVFRIFFAESFVIAMINFVLSSIGVFAATVIFNQLMRTEVGILITILSFGIRQLILLLAVSIFVAFIASFLPVKRIASKRPIDAIRNR
ncbi:MAG: ABC transporter permease, partial [Acutalibacteraceae bacterium]|nr:ABC transporter permease [Acutalibacteraceae bacterium]